MIGIIKGYEIKKNKDSIKNRLLLQVETIAETDDIRTVELFQQAGEDCNPAEGARILIIEPAMGYQIGIATHDNLVPEVDPGEKEIYSTDSPATEKKAKIKLSANGDIEIDAYGGATLKIKADGNIEINGTADSAMGFTNTKAVIEEIQQDITDLKTAFNSWVVVAQDGGAALKASAAAWTATPLIENINDSEIDTVKLP